MTRCLRLYFKFGIVIQCFIALFTPTYSLAFVNPVIEVNLPNTSITQAQSVMIENALIQKKYTDAITFINNELKKDPNNTALLYKKVGIYIEMEDYDKANETLKQINAQQPNQAESIKLQTIIDNAIKNTVHNEIGFNQDEAYVSDAQDYWTFSSLHYYRFTKAGTYGARVNYASRFDTTGEQYQLEAYPKFENNLHIEYIQLKFAYANFTQILFPNYQYIVEPFFTLPANFELSIGQAGLRSMGTNIYTLTGSLANYVGNNYIWFRPYHYTPKASNFFEAGIRHYFNEKNTYLSCKIGAGKAPDILDLAPLNQIVVLNQKLIAINGQLPFTKDLFLQAGAGYLRQVFPSGLKREITDGNIGIIWQF